MDIFVTYYIRVVFDVLDENLQDALVMNNLKSILSGSNRVTVFAPRNIPADLDISSANKELLMYHIVPGSISASMLKECQVVTTLQGSTLKITMDSSGNVVVGGNAKVVSADLKAQNGVVHSIDSMLTVPVGDAPVCDDDDDNTPTTKIAASASAANGMEVLALVGTVTASTVFLMAC